jgi:hypothetical protein
VPEEMVVESFVYDTYKIEMVAQHGSKGYSPSSSSNHSM